MIQSEKEYNELIDMILYYDKMYYDNSINVIGDTEYDKLLYEISDYEAKNNIINENSPSVRVGLPYQSNKFDKVKHKYPMLSIKNSYTVEDVIDTCNTILSTPDTVLTRAEIIFEPKLDGISLSVTYVDGILSQALTRGNGTVGEDVTRLARAITNLPKTIKAEKGSTVVIRGECVISKKDFALINEERANSDLEPYANPRNLASGTLRQLDPAVVQERKLQFIAYNMPEYDYSDEKTCLLQSDVLGMLKWDGFTTNKFITVDSVDLQYPDRIERLLNKIKELNDDELPLDGVVIKANWLDSHKAIGYTNKYPKWAIAYKYPCESIKTKLIDIIWTVGRSGKLTPTAHFEPIYIDANIEYATLHNAQNVITQNICVGDIVEVVKSAEVIPYITNVIHTDPDNKRHRAVVPDKCPVCGKPVSFITNDEQTGVDLYCTNKECDGIIQARLSYFVSRSVADIQGLADNLIARIRNHPRLAGPNSILIENGWDLISWFPPVLPKICTDVGISPTRADVICEQIRLAKEKLDLPRIILGLMIPGVGSGVAKLLAKTYKDLEVITKLTEEDLCKVNGIGPQLAKSIVSYFKDPYNKYQVEELINDKEYNTSIEVNTKRTKNKSIEGKTFCITGKFDKYTRNELIEMIEARGGSVTSSVSKKLDYLIASSDESNSTKYKKAKELDKPIISETDFDEMLLEDIAI